MKLASNVKLGGAKAWGEGCVNYMVLSRYLSFFYSLPFSTCHTHTHTHTHTQHNLVSLLVSSINYLEHAERYEMMAEVFKLLQPFYEKQRDFKVGDPSSFLYCLITFLYLYVVVLIYVKSRQM